MAANKAPFTDDELKRIVDACDAVKIEWKNETGLGVWTGEGLKDLIWLMAAMSTVAGGCVTSHGPCPKRLAPQEGLSAVTWRSRVL